MVVDQTQYNIEQSPAVPTNHRSYVNDAVVRRKSAVFRRKDGKEMTPDEIDELCQLVRAKITTTGKGILGGTVRIKQGVHYHTFSFNDFTTSAYTEYFEGKVKDPKQYEGIQMIEFIPWYYDL